jgi:hypothetical protein
LFFAVNIKTLDNPAIKRDNLAKTHDNPAITHDILEKTHDDPAFTQKQSEGIEEKHFTNNIECF